MVKITVKNEKAYVPVRNGELMRDDDKMPLLFPTKSDALQCGPCGFRAGVKAVRVTIEYHSEETGQ